MNTILVTATAESSGKTAVALALATLSREEGRAVGYMKPKGTRLESVVGKTIDSDPDFARDLLGLDAELAEMEPIVYSPTFIEETMRGREDPDALRETVRDRFDRLAADCEFMAVEGGGTLTTGRAIDLADPALADLLDAAVLLVVGYERPGDVDTILGATDRLGDALAGVVFNAVPDGVYDRVETDVIPFLERRGVPVLGVLPRVQELAGVTVADLAAELGAEVLTDAPTETYLERFLVGAMGPDASLQSFRRTKDAAVITGGDRSEIHTVALEAPGVKCLLLTGGHRPSGAVLGTADERDVPVLLVGTDTMTTIDRAESVVRSGRTRDARTVERMAELLVEHVHVEELLDR